MVKYFLSFLALIGLTLGITLVFVNLHQPPTPKILFPPPEPPFKHFIACEGIVEAISENIEIGTPFGEIVEAVFVEPGDKVLQGAPLFQLNTELLQAELKQAQASLAVAEAEYKKEMDLPRPENVPIQEALVKQAEFELENRQKRFEIVQKLENTNAVSQDEYNQRKYAALVAEAKLLEEQEILNKLLAGSWVQTLEIFRAEIRRAKTRIDEIVTKIQRSTIKAPFDGTIMRVHIHPGEYAQINNPREPLMFFGKVNQLMLRANIDEEDVWRVKKQAPGRAYIRGNSSMYVDLDYLRIDPFLIPKYQLINEVQEQVDTRVLQVVYGLDPQDLPIYPGMILDVYLEAKPHSET